MNIIRLEEIDSTNLYSKKNINSLSDRTIVIANRQTSGRGRFDRKWIDLGFDNIFMSIILKPSSNFMHCYPNLTQYLSLCICNSLEKYSLRPEIKWPNDVLIDGKKIAGILAETVVQGGSFEGLILGLGVNVNSTKEAISKIEDKSATSINLELGLDYVSKEEFLNTLLTEFFENYDRFLNIGFEMIKDEYLKRACFLNKEISVQVFNDTKSGTVKSVNNSGELVLENDNKELVLTMGDIL